jgi:hypothetical protein
MSQVPMSNENRRKKRRLRLQSSNSRQMNEHH